VNDTATGFVEKPRVRPADARFSSGPCRKHPGWSIESLSTDHLGRSHRAAKPKAHLKSAIDRSAALLALPDDWKLGIVPGSDTGAFEMAMWSLLGNRAVDAFVWESFSSDWAKDLASLNLKELQVHEADYGQLPALSAANPKNDIVFVYNGTTSGVRVPNLDWIADDREGLVLCDATSAAYAMPMDYSKIDVLTWSWQKVLGGEAAHGMLALSPRAVERLESEAAPRALPKVFTLTKKQALDHDTQQAGVKTMVSWLAEEGVAFDIANYRNAPPGFRIWGGATVESEDVEALTAWLDWAYTQFETTVLNAEVQHG